MPIAGEITSPTFGGNSLEPGAAPSADVLQSRRVNRMETFLFWFFGACATISVVTTFGIVYVLITDSIPFFREASIVEFLTGREWEPRFEGKFGVLPLVTGTLLVTVLSATFGLPMGLLTAIYLSEYASPRARNLLKPILEILAGVPTVVYGFFALIFITPLLQKLFMAGQPPGAELRPDVFNALSASIAMAIMILPLVSSLCEDALHVVPRALREGAYALGATKMEVSLQVVVPAALSGIAASFILAISRAIGETMIVAMAAGLQPKMSWNPLESVMTMTTYIVETQKGEQPHGTIAYQSIFAVGLLLFGMTIVMNLLSIALVKKYRQKYD